MGRGKNSRRRESLDGRPPVPAAGPSCGPSSCHFFPPNSRIDSHLPALVTLDSTAPSNAQEVRDAIEFHWKNLSLDLRSFLFSNPQELNLRKFLGYWTDPARVRNANPNIAASICGCSWYLALNYMSIGMVVEARALILNGCFLQQCYNKPIEEIASIAGSADYIPESLPFFTDGLYAISTEERMLDFLKRKVSSDYQRRMSFATETTQSKKKVQDYVKQIGGDWNSGASNSAAATRRRSEARRRASLESLPAESFIEIRLVDSQSGDEKTMRYGLNMPLKTLFKTYAEKRNLSLRQLRFSYEGKTLFLSSVGGKTPQDLGMENLDSIHVIDNAQSQQREREEDTTSSSSGDESKENSDPSKGEPSRKGRKGKHRRQCRRASWSGPEIGADERPKLTHSCQLSRVFSEAAPRFEQIRRRLNVLNLACTLPKVKTPRRRDPVAPETLLSTNPEKDWTGGKAGVPFHAVHVGAPENLYNTKNANLPSLNGQKAISVDLHGLTREQALSDLDARLPGWVDLAMRGAHPFVIKVVIICGGGNQVLSEAVDSWIRGNESVARAPKRRFSKRRSI